MRVFLDACVFYSAARSAQGGSAKIIIEARERGFVVLFTMGVLLEIKRHTIEDLGEIRFQNMISLLRKAPRELIKTPTQEEIRSFSGVTVEKDLHVLAGAVKGRADALVTLDRKHLLKQSVRDSFSIKIMNTKEFWSAIREGEL